MADGGKKNRKIGRNKLGCLRYKNERRHEKSHYRRVKKHFADGKHPNDHQNKKVLEDLYIKVG